MNVIDPQKIAPEDATVDNDPGRTEQESDKMRGR